jgi:hypothetical protein
MSRNASLGDLRTWARQLSDTESDVNITDAELTALANRHLPEVYDRLVDAGPADYYAASTQITTSSGIIPYPLDVTFRNLTGVYVRESADERRPLLPMPNVGRGAYKAPTGVWTLDVEFIPVPDVLEDPGDTFDGVSGFEELIANLMARDVMAKRESDPSIVMSNIARLEQRITTRARNRDKGNPKRVSDLDDTNFSPFPWGWTGNSRLACYRLRAGNLELYEALWTSP